MLIATDKSREINMARNKKAKYIAVPFLIILYAFFLVNIAIPDEKISTVENRTLTRKPGMEDMNDGTYAEKYDKYYTDHFAFRNEMLRIYRRLEVALGKSVVGYYYLVDNNWILGMFPRILTSAALDKYSGAINSLAEICSDMGNVKVYFTLLPHKTNMLKHLYPEYVNNKKNIDINKESFQSRLNPDLITFLDTDGDMSNQFSGKELEKLYFKTDHHWNGTGAFEGFKRMAQKMDLGVSPEKLREHFSKYKMWKDTTKDFIGSYNSSLNMIVHEKEYPIFVYLEDQHYEFFQNHGGEDKRVKEENIIATSRHKKEWDYGGAYIRGDKCNILKIKNSNALTNKKILVFRDSYQAPTTLMFADLFRDVILIDPRNISRIDMTYEEIIKTNDPDIVMFLYNSSGFDSMIINMIKKGIR